MVKRKRKGKNLKGKWKVFDVCKNSRQADMSARAIAYGGHKYRIVHRTRQSYDDDYVVYKGPKRKTKKKR